MQIENDFLSISNDRLRLLCSVFIFCILVAAQMMISRKYADLWMKSTGEKKQKRLMFCLRSFRFVFFFFISLNWFLSCCHLSLFSDKAKTSYFFAHLLQSEERRKKHGAHFSFCFDIYDKLSYTQESKRPQRSQQNYCAYILNKFDACSICWLRFTRSPCYLCI